MATYIDSLPSSALLLVMLAWIIGAFGGGILACFIARNRPRVYSSIVGGMVLLGTVYNLTQLPHPMWFSITSVIAIAATAYLTGQLGASFTESQSGE